MLLSGYYGPQIWQTPLSTLVDLPPSFEPIGGFRLRDFWVPVLIFSFFVAHLPSCVVNVVRARREKNLPVAPVFVDWLPILLYVCATCAWFSSEHTILLKDNHLILFCLTQSFVFGRMTTKIILAHLTKQPFPYWTVLMAPLIGGAVLVNAPKAGFRPLSPRWELIYLYGYFLFAIIVYFRWALLVINSICNYLGIKCLTIPRKKENIGKHEANGKVE